MSEKAAQLLVLLDRLSDELTQAGLWSLTPPSVEALRSSQPFCCDTLRLEQWLQFVFIERLRFMAKTEQPLPENIAVTPMAEHVFSPSRLFSLIDVIADIDTLLSGKAIVPSWH